MPGKAPALQQPPAYTGAQESGLWGGCPCSCLAGRESSECSIAQAHPRGRLPSPRLSVSHSFSGCLFPGSSQEQADDMRPTLRNFSVHIFSSLEATGSAADPLRIPDSTAPKILERPLQDLSFQQWGLHPFPVPSAPRGCPGVPHIQALG